MTAPRPRRQRRESRFSFDELDISDFLDISLGHILKPNANPGKLTDADLLEIWQEHRDMLMTLRDGNTWMGSMGRDKFTLPALWWRCESPDDPVLVVDQRPIIATFDSQIDPTWRKGEVVGHVDLYESQVAYLQRHDLLDLFTPEERAELPNHQETRREADSWASVVNTFQLYLPSSERKKFQ